MTDTNSAAAVAGSAKETRWHRLLKHRHVHIGANATSTLMGLALALWIWKIYWLTTGAPSPLTVAWVIAIYMAFEPMTAALTVFRRDRWKALLTDFGIGILLVIQTCIVLYDHNNLAFDSARAHLAWLFLFVTAGALAESILVTMVVNTRTISDVRAG